MKKKILFASALVIVLIAGIFIGSRITAANYEKTIIDPIRYEKANVAAVHLSILSLLRIGDKDEAIEILEGILNNETLVITQRTNDPSELPQQVVRVLKQIKAYREIFPPGINKVQIKRALEKTPPLTDYKKDCQSGLCRLLEQQKSGKINSK